MFDVIHHSGLATLGGALEVSLLSGFTQSAGNAFEIITATGGVSGTFATELMPDLAGGLLLDVIYSPTALMLSVARLLGDYNFDGTVDAADYLVWRKTLNQMGTGLAADGNGQIDPGDYDIWRAHFGETAGTGSSVEESAVVPEPSAIALSCLAMLAVRRARVRQYDRR